MTRSSSTLAVLTLTAALAGCGPATTASSPSASTVATPSPAAPASSALPSASSAAGSPSAGTSASASPSGSAGALAPIDPANFTTTIDNAWFPLIPGTTFTYRGVKDGEKAVDVYTVTDETKLIDGVTCVVVDDRLTLDGTLAEKTSDYYVQDLAGNVWYFGEDTAELEDGKVKSREGTWHAGVDGAQAGIFMEADPVVGHAYAQEYYKGHAEDHFEVETLTDTVKVPLGSFTGVLRTKEWTPLEPDVLDAKYYVKGVGEVKEATIKGDPERLELVKVDRP
ncbi:MAG: hypothetical protein ACJ761_11135 [Chloroflexota bacterium]